MSKAALANAYRQVNAAYSRLPRDRQEEIEITYDEFDREIEQAMIHDEAERATRAIHEFKVHWLNKIGRRR